MTSVLAFALFLPGSPGQAKPIELLRKFTAGEKLSYFARAQFTQEQRSGSLQTMLPADEEISYRFSLNVQKVKADGIAEILYLRPTMEIVEGDTADSAAKKTVEKLDLKFLLDVTPINEVVAQKDLNPPKKPKDKDAQLLRTLGEKVRKQGTQADGVALSLLFSFVGEIQRLAFFVGPLDSGLDIAPTFSFDEVTVGSTWKKTVGYSPQKLKGQGNKQAVQRLDYTYTYMGVMKNKEGKDVQRIQGKVKLATDLIEYARQLVGGSASTSFFKSVPLNFEGTIDFDLDMTTLHMTKAAAVSTGSFAIELKGVDQAYLENKFRGRTSVKLESRLLGQPPMDAKPAATTSTKKGKGGRS
jgi:hypothetical protein